MSAAAGVAFLKGPLGWAVLLDGRSVGVIKRVPSDRTFHISINGLRPGDGRFPLGKGHYSRPSLTAAKKAAEAVLTGAAS